MKFTMLSTLLVVAAASVAAVDIHPDHPDEVARREAPHLAFLEKHHSKKAIETRTSCTAPSSFLDLAGWISYNTCLASSGNNIIAEFDSLWGSNSWWSSSYTQSTCNIGTNSKCAWSSLFNLCISTEYAPSGSASASIPSTKSCPSSNFKWNGALCLPTTSTFCGYSTIPDLANGVWSQTTCSTQGHSWSSSLNCCHGQQTQSSNTTLTQKSCIGTDVSGTYGLQSTTGKTYDLNNLWWPLSPSKGQCCNAKLTSSGKCDNDPVYSKPQACPNSGSWLWDDLNNWCTPATTSDCGKSTAEVTCLAEGHFWCSKSATCRQCTGAPSSSTPSTVCASIDVDAFLWKPCAKSTSITNVLGHADVSICLSPRTKPAATCGSDSGGFIKSCPDTTNWLWDAINGCCTPTNKATGDKCTGSTTAAQPSCSTAGHYWSSSTNCCKRNDPAPTTPVTAVDSCNDIGDFWWANKKACCNTGTKNATDTSTVPSNASCPKSYLWCPINKICLPPTSDEGSHPLPTLPCWNPLHLWNNALGYCTPGTTTGKCSSTSTNSFSWTNLLGEVLCLIEGYNENTSCPTATSCPTNYNWSSKYGYCVPSTSCSTPTTGTTPAGCVATHTWFGTLGFCAPPAFIPSGSLTCTASNSKHFLWSLDGSCRLGNYNGTGAACDSGKSCPTGFYWSALSGIDILSGLTGIFGRCVPSTSTIGGSTPTCQTSVTGQSDHKWDPSSKNQCCHGDVTPGSDSNHCSTDQFFWNYLGGSTTRAYCVNNNCSRNDTVPAKTCCPTGWNYHSLWKICYPTPGHSCGSGSGTKCPPPACTVPTFWWGANDCFCSPQGASQKANLKRRSRGALKSKLPLGVVDSARCPDKLTACPVAGATDGTSYECIDPQTELESCGGCASLNTGVDCTAIPGARSAQCVAGQCSVYSCSAGYIPSLKGDKCVRSKQSLLQSQKRAAVRRSHSF